MSTFTDGDGIERIVTIADPAWEPAPSEVVYPVFDENGERVQEEPKKK